MHTNPIGLWPVGIFFVVFIALIVFANVQRKKRTRALASLAQSIGFIFEGSAWNDTAQASRLQSCFPGSRFANIMSGTFAGLRTTLFDSTHRHGKHSHTQMAAAFSHDLWLPEFLLLPNHPMLNPVFRLLRPRGSRSIEFPSHPDFSHRWFLLSIEKDEDKVRELFTPTLLAFLEGLPPKELCILKGEGSVLVVSRNRPERLQDVPTFLEQASSIAKTFLDCCALKKAG